MNKMTSTRISADTIQHVDSIEFTGMNRLELMETLRNTIERNLDNWKGYLDPVSSNIEDDYLEDDGQWLDLTFSTNDEYSSFGWQTGDNSFTGGAYGHPHWAVVSLSHFTTVKDLVTEVMDQWDDLIAQSTGW